MTTGQLIADAAGVPFVVLDDLNDIDYGEWQGRSHEEVRQQWPAQYRRWLKSPHLARFPCGESLRQLSTRLVNAFRLIVEKHPDATTVIVGHVGGNRVLLLQALGLPLSAYWRIAQDPCGLSEIIVTHDDLSVQRTNDTAHLEPQELSSVINSEPLQGAAIAVKVHSHCPSRTMDMSWLSPPVNLATRGGSADILPRRDRCGNLSE